MSEITMPSLSDSMEEGTILTWLVGDGEPVQVGQELLEVETDKATVTVCSEVAGVLSILVAPGATVAVGTVIAQARAGAAASDAGAPQSAGGQAPPRSDPPSSAPPSSAPVPGAPPSSAPVPGAPPSSDQSAAVPAGPAPATGNGSATPATPLARRAAREHGVSLQQLRGSGPRGRITRADVLAAAGVDLPQPSAAPAPPASSDPAPPGETLSASAGRGQARAAPAAPGETVALTRIQQVIARRMSESRTAVPEFEVQTEVSMDEALALRSRLRELDAAGAVPSVNDLIVKAVALALRRHPRLNASFIDGALRLHHCVHIGVAVATEDSLIVPTVRDADTRSLASLAAETRRLAERVRSGQVSPEELSGAGFTVSNLGMFGMTAIRPIINAPQVGILGVGMARESLARVDGEIVPRRLMTLTLSCDHRAVYGADAARCLADVRELLQAPLRLML